MITPRGKLTADAPLAPLVWFKTGGAAQWLFEPADADDLATFLAALDPAVPVVTVPGVTAFSAAAALANRPVGEGKQLVTIVPASDDLRPFLTALDGGGTVVLMKIGQRLEKVLDELEERNLLDQAVFVSYAGMPQQRVETDVRRLRALAADPVSQQQQSTAVNFRVIAPVARRPQRIPRQKSRLCRGVERV